MKQVGLVKAVLVLLLVAGLTAGCRPMEKLGYVRMRKYNEAVDGLQNARAEASRWKSELDALGGENGDLRQRTGELSQQLAAANRDKLEIQHDLEQYRAGTSRLNTQLSAMHAELKRLTSLAMFDWNPNNNSLVVRAHFALGSADIQPADKKPLARAAAILKRIPQSYTICIDGHTDDLPVKHPKTVEKYLDNWGLGVHRALSVLRVLKAHGVDPDRMIARSRAHYDPLVRGTTPAARRKNRRVEITIAPKTPLAHLATLNE